MKKKKSTALCNGWDSESYLPPELWPGILCKLPVKSLLRFRCVSKPWLSLIDDHDFARLHMKNFKNNCDETHLLFVERKKQNFVIRCSVNFETCLETLLTPGKGSWDFVSSLDGLILLKSNSLSDNTRFGVLKLWNPSIRKFHIIPSLPAIEDSRSDQFEDVDLGLAYDSSANDYKHVKLINLDYKTLHSVAIYSLGTGSWKMIPFQGNGCSWRCDQQTQKIHLKGRLYFISNVPRDLYAKDLVSFDLSSGVFSSIRLPASEVMSKLGLIDNGCSVAVFNSSGWKNSVWVLESSRDGSESVCWTNRYSFLLKYNQFLYLKQNGDMFIQKGRRETLTDETGEKQVVTWDQVASYNPETQEYKIMQERKSSCYMISHVSPYIQSLLLLK